MTLIATDDTKVYNGEPARLKGLLVSIAGVVLAIITGNTTAVDGGNAIALAVAAFVVPLVQGEWTRRSVSAVTKTSADV